MVNVDDSSEAKYTPIGRFEWSNGNVIKQLSLSNCTSGLFTCNDGQCVPLR